MKWNKMILIAVIACILSSCGKVNPPVDNTSTPTVNTDAAVESTEGKTDKESYLDTLDCTPYENEYVFQTLDENDKKLYVYLINAFYNFETEIDVLEFKVYKAHLIDMVDLITANHPELHWINTKKVVIRVKFHGFHVSKLCIQYDESYTKNVEEQIRFVDSELNSILEMAKDFTDAEATVFFHEYLNTRFTYQVGGEDQNMYDALKNNQTVCSGYAKTFLALCKRRGIDCLLVCGTGITGNPHGWVMFKLDDGWYESDPTSTLPDGSISFASCNQTSAVFDEAGYIREKLVIDYPVATGTEYSIQNMFGIDNKYFEFYYRYQTNVVIHSLDEYIEYHDKKMIENSLATNFVYDASHHYSFVVTSEEVVNEILDYIENLNLSTHYNDFLDEYDFPMYYNSTDSIACHFKFIDGEYRVLQCSGLYKPE